MTTNNNRHHIHHHEHFDESEIYKRKNLSAAQRRKKLAKILFRFLCVIAVAITSLVIYVCAGRPSGLCSARGRSVSWQ